MKRRILTEAEEALWQMVTQHDQKMFSRHLPESVPVNRPRVAQRQFVEIPVEWQQVAQAPLVLGGYAGIDRNTAERFKKGELPLEGVVDLHGMSREKAHHAVGAFIHSHFQRGSRCLLAITGKGLKKGYEPEQAGVLRELLPQWLTEPGLRPFVLACDIAKPKHGGTGAYYILLRRKR